MIRAGGVFCVFLFMGVLSVSCRSSNLPTGQTSPGPSTLYAEGKQQSIASYKSTNDNAVKKDNTVCRIRIWYVAPDKFRHEEHFADHVNVRVINGMDGWLFGSQDRVTYSWRKPSVGFKTWDDERKDITGGSKEWILSGAKRLGQETINGLVCDVYLRKNKESTLKGWFPKDGVPIPRRLEMVGRPGFFAGVTSFRTTIDFVKRESGIQIEEAWFRPPASYQIQPAPQPMTGVLPLENL